MQAIAGYGMVAATIALTVYGQMVMKWQSTLAGPAPADGSARAMWLIEFLFRPFVISCFAAAFIAAVAWIFVLNRFHLSWAYPFMSLTFPIVVFLSGIVFHEPISALKAGGVMLIMVGVALQAAG